jgi:hypothetical protein
MMNELFAVAILLSILFALAAGAEHPVGLDAIVDALRSLDSGPLPK